MSRAIRLEIEKHGASLRDLPRDTLDAFAAIVGAYAVDLRDEQARRDDHASLEAEMVIVLRAGLVAATVCVPEEMPTEKVVEEANRLLGPTGLYHGWMLSSDAEFAQPVLPNGKKLPNPCPCERTPGRVHRLLEC